jgi:hypothetical protein
MSKADEGKWRTQSTVTIEEVNRVLDIGKLLLAVLTPSELEELAVLAKEKANRKNGVAQPDR